MRKIYPNHTKRGKCYLLEWNYCLWKQTLNSWTPITANMNSSKHVTRTILPIVLTATMTHCTTCYNVEKCTWTIDGNETTIDQAFVSNMKESFRCEIERKVSKDNATHGWDKKRMWIRHAFLFHCLFNQNLFFQTITIIFKMVSKVRKPQQDHVHRPNRTSETISIPDKKDLQMSASTTTIYF